MSIHRLYVFGIISVICVCISDSSRARARARLEGSRGSQEHRKLPTCNSWKLDSLSLEVQRIRS